MPKISHAVEKSTITIINKEMREIARKNIFFVFSNSNKIIDWSAINPKNTPNSFQDPIKLSVLNGRIEKLNIVWNIWKIKSKTAEINNK